MQLVHPGRKSHTTWVGFVHGHGRQPRRDRPDFGDRTEVAWIAHQMQARHVAQRVRHSLQPGFQCFPTERLPQTFIDREPRLLSFQTPQNRRPRNYVAASVCEVTNIGSRHVLMNFDGTRGAYSCEGKKASVNKTWNFVFILVRLEGLPSECTSGNTTEWGLPHLKSR